MNIQEIFNRVIDRGYYDTSHANSAMCNSLASALSWDDISEDEYQFAREQIDNYLLPTDCWFFQPALKQAGLPHDIEARSAIYRDWANRPALTSSTEE